MPDIDRDNYVSWGHGMELRHVMIAGRTYAPSSELSVVTSALSVAVHAAGLGHRMEIHR